MTIEELEKEQLTKSVSTSYYHEGASSWADRKAEEDAKLNDMKCPKCSSEVALEVNGGSWHYTCKRDKFHTYYRWVGFNGPS